MKGNVVMSRFKKNKADASPSATLFEQCEHLFAASRRLVREDPDGCADLILDLAFPDDGGTWELSFQGGPYPHPYYGMFPPEGTAGHGSFMNPDGSFERHGRITEPLAARVLATAVPTRHKARR
jgi:hypothetical protein